MRARPKRRRRSKPCSPITPTSPTRPCDSAAPRRGSGPPRLWCHRRRSVTACTCSRSPNAPSRCARCAARCSARSCLDTYLSLSGTMASVIERAARSRARRDHGERPHRTRPHRAHGRAGEPARARGRRSVAARARGDRHRLAHRGVAAGLQRPIGDRSRRAVAAVGRHQPRLGHRQRRRATSRGAGFP